jgi:hypothetical protein
MHADVGTSLHCGDEIETGADGAVKIIFKDGTAFNLAGNARMVLDEFTCDSEGHLKSGLFNLIRGAFAFITGKLTPSGNLWINTPVAKIRGNAGGGLGVLTLAAFTFALLKEAQAVSQDLAFLIDDAINYKDLEHGIFQVTTRDGQVITVDDPGETVVIRPRGGGVSVDHIVNSPQQMADLLAASKAAQETYAIGQQDIDVTDLVPTAGSSSSGGIVTPLLPLPEAPAPVGLPQSPPPPPPPPPPAMRLRTTLADNSDLDTKPTA